MQLSRDHVRQLILEKNLITNYGSVDGQLTANGFDCRLAAIIEVLDGGTLAIDKKNIKAPLLGKAVVLKGYEHRLKDYVLESVDVVDAGTVKLEPLKPYLVMTCEELNMPDNLMTLIAARTSLFRLTQCLLGATFGEAGYKGYLAFMLLPFTSSSVELGVRFAQLSFSQLSGSAQYDAQKVVNHQGGKLFNA